MQPGCVIIGRDAQHGCFLTITDIYLLLMAYSNKMTDNLAFLDFKK